MFKVEWGNITSDKYNSSCFEEYNKANKFQEVLKKFNSKDKNFWINLLTDAPEDASEYLIELVNNINEDDPNENSVDPLAFVKKLQAGKSTGKKQEVKVINKKIIALDLETTGINPYEDEILQFSIIDDKLNTLFSDYIKPVRHTSWEGAMRVNGITPQMVNNKPTLLERRQELINILDSADIVIGYNSDRFDFPMLEKELGYKIKAQKVDVMKLFQKEFALYSKIPMKLVVACAFFGIDIENAHDALADTIGTMKLFLRMTEEAKKDPLAEIFEFDDGKKIYNNKLAQDYANKSGAKIVKAYGLSNGKILDLSKIDKSKYRASGFIKPKTGDPVEPWNPNSNVTNKKVNKVDKKDSDKLKMLYDYLKEHCQDDFEWEEDSADVKLKNDKLTIDYGNASYTITCKNQEYKTVDNVTKEHGYYDTIAEVLEVLGIEEDNPLKDKIYQVKVYDIDWDTYDEDSDKEYSQEELELPKSVSLYNIEANSEEEVLQERIADILSDNFDYCVNSMKHKDLKIQTDDDHDDIEDIVRYENNNFEGTGMSEKDIKNLSNEDMDKMGLNDEDEHKFKLQIFTNEDDDWDKLTHHFDYLYGDTNPGEYLGIEVDKSHLNDSEDSYVEITGYISGVDKDEFHDYIADGIEQYKTNENNFQLFWDYEDDFDKEEDEDDIRNQYIRGDISENSAIKKLMNIGFTKNQAHDFIGTPSPEKQIKLTEVLSWISEHNQAWEDFCNAFELDEQEKEDVSEASKFVDVEDVLDWISEHETLQEDYDNKFGEAQIVNN